MKSVPFPSLSSIFLFFFSFSLISHTFISSSPSLSLCFHFSIVSSPFSLNLSILSSFPSPILFPFYYAFSQPFSFSTSFSSLLRPTSSPLCHPLLFLVTPFPLPYLLSFIFPPLYPHFPTLLSTLPSIFHPIIQYFFLCPSRFQILPSVRLLLPLSSIPFLRPSFQPFPTPFHPSSTLSSPFQLSDTLFPASCHSPTPLLTLFFSHHHSMLLSFPLSHSCTPSIPFFYIFPFSLLLSSLLRHFSFPPFPHVCSSHIVESV